MACFPFFLASVANSPVVVATRLPRPWADADSSLPFLRTVLAAWLASFLLDCAADFAAAPTRSNMWNEDWGCGGGPLPRRLVLLAIVFVLDACEVGDVNVESSIIIDRILLSMDPIDIEWMASYISLRSWSVKDWLRLRDASSSALLTCCTLRTILEKLYKCDATSSRLLLKNARSVGGMIKLSLLRMANSTFL